MKIPIETPLFLVVSFTLFAPAGTLRAAPQEEPDPIAKPAAVVAAEGPRAQDLSTKISKAALFYQNLACVGPRQPSDADNVALWAAVETMRTKGVQPALPNHYEPGSEKGNI